MIWSKIFFYFGLVSLATLRLVNVGASGIGLRRFKPVVSSSNLHFRKSSSLDNDPQLFSIHSHRRTMVSQWLHWVIILTPSAAGLWLASYFLPTELIKICMIILGSGLFALETASILSESAKCIPEAATKLDLPQAATNMGLPQVAINLSLPTLLISIGIILAKILPAHDSNRSNTLYTAGSHR